MTHSLMQRGISAGMGFANTAVEGAILGLMGSDSPYGNGKARLNFNWYIDEKGNSRFGGEGDVLWPLYDSLHTTVYTQIGARSMFSGGDKYGPDRWIGNFGLGQRWFPGAKMGEDGKTVDSGNWMIGYNAFFDYDFTRGHQRGGLGVEAQYDWFKIGSNYYVPLSDWKGSKDFEGNFVQERAAQGWDLRAKGYLPFYREIAITGSFTQWYGDHVGMFGPAKLEKDPRVWSYGVEYTPVPAMTAYVNQRQTEGGRADTEFGLRFTYHFGMDAESQFKPSRVAEMRTVHGARHDFVDRENKIILEYRAKNRFHIDFLSFDGANTFTFRIRNGFDKYVAGQTVRVMAGGAVLLAAAPEQSKILFAQVLDTLDGLISVRSAHADSGFSYVTDANGLIRVRVNSPNALDTLSVQAGESGQTFTRSQMGMGSKSKLMANPVSIAKTGTSTLTLNGMAANAAVTWSITSGGTLGTLSTTSTTTDANGTSSVTFTANNSSSSAPATIQASVGGQNYTCTVQVGGVPTLTLAVSGGSAFVSGASTTATVTPTAKDSSGTTVTINPGDITWTVESSSISAAWWGNRAAGNTNGLAWGATPVSLNRTDAPRTTMVGTVPTGASAQLTDIVGSRTVVVKAAMTIGGTAYSQTATITFGDGPLSVFAGTPKGSSAWAGAYSACGGTGNINSSGYQASTKLPTSAQLKNVAGSAGGKQGAAHAAGWPDDNNGSGWFCYWTGEADGDGISARFVYLDDGNEGTRNATISLPVAVCLP